LCVARVLFDDWTEIQKEKEPQPREERKRKTEETKPAITKSHQPKDTNTLCYQKNIIGLNVQIPIAC